MQLIIPMAGQGKRMWPHTLTTPKPFISIVGKPIIERLIKEITKSCQQKITTVGFITHDLKQEQIEILKKIVSSIGAEIRFYKQPDPLGTAHAIFCAAELLEGPIIIAFADTLFTTDQPLDTEQESVIFVKKIKDPSEFGIVKLKEQNHIQNFIEKPKEFISNFAMIGLYYFRNSSFLRQALEQLLQIKVTGEYLFTSALNAMCKNGIKFIAHEVAIWLDCGTKDAIVHANKMLLLQLQEQENLITRSASINNSIIIPPVYIGQNVFIHNTVLGPYVSVGCQSSIHDSRIKNSLIQAYSCVDNANLDWTMLGNHVNLSGIITTANIGDYNTINHHKNDYHSIMPTHIV